MWQNTSWHFLLQKGLSILGRIHTGESQSSHDEIGHKAMAALVKKWLFQVIHSLLDFTAPVTGTTKLAKPISSLCRGRTSVYTDAYLWWCKRMWITLIMRHFSVVAGRLHLPVWTRVVVSDSLISIVVSYRTFVSHQCECCLRHPADAQKCKSEAVKWFILTLQLCVPFLFIRMQSKKTGYWVHMSVAEMQTAHFLSSCWRTEVCVCILSTKRTGKGKHVYSNTTLTVQLQPSHKNHFHCETLICVSRDTYIGYNHRANAVQLD